jgi:hypothetical protein
MNKSAASNRIPAALAFATVAVVFVLNVLAPHGELRQAGTDAPTAKNASSVSVAMPANAVALAWALSTYR